MAEITTKIIGASPNQEAILREILSGLGPTRIEVVEIVANVDREWGAPPDAVGFETKASSRDGYAAWQGMVAGEVFARRSHDLHLPPVAYVADPDSSSTMVDHDYAAALSSPSLTRAEIEKALRKSAEIAKEHGASARIRLLEPHRLAFDIELTAAEPAEFLLRGLEPTLTPLDELDRERYDGRHIKVVDGNGDWVLELGAGYGVRADLEACSPIVTFGKGLFEPDPPPCPAK